jgi:hypothetical protein
MIDHRNLGSRSLSHEQKVAIALGKSVTATLSVIASSLIIRKIYLQYRRYQSKSSTVVSGSIRSSINEGLTTYHRMLLSISILDVIHSTSSAFSTLLVPSYTNGTFAHGTTATCSMQGALQQLTPTIVIYMAMLNTYFMLKIRYNIADSVINRRFEIWFHAIPMTHFLSTAITGLSMHIFGPIILPELGCWLDSYCAYKNICTRSGPIFYEHLDYYAWSFSYIWLFISVIVVSINAVMIYTAIRSQEKRNAKYLGARLQKEALSCSSLPHTTQSSSCVSKFNESGEIVASTNENKGRPIRSSELLLQSDKAEETELTIRSRNYEYDESTFFESMIFSVPPVQDSTNDMEIDARLNNASDLRRTNAIKHSRIAAVQSILYVSSALFTAIWIFMPWVGNKLQVQSNVRFFFAFMVSIVSPSQGIFNLFIFVRLQYLRLRETNKEWCRWKCVKECLFSLD